jgi:transcriptional regulator with XRE-family HTH domain
MSIDSILPTGLRFGDRFWVAWKRREIRDLRPVTPKEIAEAVALETGREGYSAEAARGWRRGSKPDPYVVKAIAKVLGCPEAELLNAEPGAQTIPRKRRVVVDARQVPKRRRGR